MNRKCGTLGYVAPEVLQGDAYDFKADVFSVGAVLFLMLSGKKLFSGKTYKEILQKNFECKLDNLQLPHLSKSGRDLLQ